MGLKSMTGFARTDGSFADTRWHWEIRSVNGRGLDLRLRLPSGYEALEQPIREACGQRIARGNVTITLNVKRIGGQTVVSLNEEALGQVVAAVQKAGALIDAAPATIDGLLSLKGVLEVSEPDESEEDVKARHSAMLASFNDALEGMSLARGEEGARLAQTLGGQLDQFEKILQAITASPSRNIDQIKQKLVEQVQRLLETDGRFDPDRLHQEAVLLATKADITEEIDRLKGHVVAARELIARDDPVGRRLDFLAQEFNREANTICSKSNDSEITRLGLEAKTIIDQMREQVQNIE